LTHYSFVRRYLTSWVSVAAVCTLAAGLIVAYLSARINELTGKTAVWWTAYLQSFSTGLIGIAATVWLVNFLSELQNHRQAEDLRAPNEIAAFSALQQFIKRLPHWLPDVDTPGNMHLFPLQWMQSQIEQIRLRCDAIAPGANDPDLQGALDEFGLRRDQWSDALMDLVQLVQTQANPQDRLEAFGRLRSLTDPTLASAQTVKDLLGNRHDFRKMKLGLPHD
jgi:hypothetical protein